MLLSDELDKALSAVASSGQTDSGVSARLFGTLLTWLNDHETDVVLSELSTTFEAARGQIVAYWRGISLPYPEPGIRLMRQDDVGPVNLQLTSLKADLEEAVHNLDRHFASLRSAARDRLGRLYNSADYPDSLRGLFDVASDFPSVEPPAYLQRLRSELYEQERRRVSAQFDEAVRLAEQAFSQELSQLVSHLSDRLGRPEDGKPKIFRDSVFELDRVLRTVPPSQHPLQ